jgi:hypothetical protein
LALQPWQPRFTGLLTKKLGRREPLADFNHIVHHSFAQRTYHLGVLSQRDLLRLHRLVQRDS